MIQCLEAIIEKVSKSIYIKNKHLYGEKKKTYTISKVILKRTNWEKCLQCVQIKG